MGKTKRWLPKDGEFKMLKASKSKRNKKERSKTKKANLQRSMKFASKHRANINMTQLNVKRFQCGSDDLVSAVESTEKEWEEGPAVLYPTEPPRPPGGIKECD